MVNLTYVKQYCEEYWKIENYQEAVNDTEQMWDCHHRHEIDWALPREELISIGRYYDVHHSELIFLTPAEHRSLHHRGKHVREETKQKISDSHKGKHHTEETKAKISAALKGENSPNYGKEGYWKGKEGPNKGKISGKNNPMYGVHRFGENNPNYKYNVTEEELYDLYVKQGLSTYKIAEIYGCCQHTIWRKLKEFNIKK